MPYIDCVKTIKQIAKDAGEIILEYYNHGFDVDIKDDNSPVTNADLAANAFIVDNLQNAFPSISIVTEEARREENINAAKNSTYWLIDPLDGTKSFIKHNDDFTVNIALMENNKTIGGVIYAPALDKCYFVGGDGKAYLEEGQIEARKIQTRTQPKEGATVVVSRAHMSEETKEYVNKMNKIKEVLSVGSSLKFCLIAEGKADIYPRLGPTMEWDTAAGQAILEAAGGEVVNIDGSEFSYGKKGFLNPGFFAKCRKNK